MAAVTVLPPTRVHPRPGTDPQGANSATLAPTTPSRPRTDFEEDPLGGGTILRPARGTDPEARVTALIARHGASLLRTAQKVSLCADDAHDAYQRALEIYLR